MDKSRQSSPDNRPGEGLKLLIIDDERSHAEAVAESLERVGYECVVATSGAEGARRIDQGDANLILTDLKMDGLDGLGIVRKAKQELPDAEVVVITGHGDVQSAVEAMKAGAANFLQKPVNLVELRAMVGKLAERFRLARTNKELKQQLDERFGFEGLIGNSQRMLDIVEKLKSIAPTQATVLIQGETGTGKELVAKAIHNNSPRKGKNFVAMNCTAINENLLEDELFGHEAHSFTGADRLRKGRFEHAHGGTLFLDEIGDMPLSLQAKLLRVLENQEITRIGSNEPIKVNVRLLSATHRDLEAAVAAKTFRQDLYFRLKVVTLKLPTLRERPGDLPLLIAHFVRDFNQRYGKRVQERPAEPLRLAMARYAWPGNVRQLRNLVESMVVQDQDGSLAADDLEESDRANLFAAGADPSGPDQLVGRSLSEIERFYVEKTLEFTAGNRDQAARKLGIGERTLYRMMQDWKQQDKIKQAIADAHGNLEEAARLLGAKPEALKRKLKKWGMET